MTMNPELLTIAKDAGVIGVLLLILWKMGGVLEKNTRILERIAGILKMKLDRDTDTLRREGQ